METPLPLAKLPEEITSLSSLIPKVGHAFTSTSVDRWFKEPHFSEINYLRSVVATWRINFSRSGTSTILFIFRRRKEPFVMLDATVSLSVRTTTPIEQQLTPALHEIQRRVMYPTFLWTNPTDAEIALFGPPGATLGNTVFFKLGSSAENILGIMNPELGKRATLRYSPKGVPGAVEPSNGKYSLRPFLDLTSTIRDWLSRNKPTTTATQLVGPPMQTTVVHEILNAFLQAYVDSNKALKTPEMMDVFQKYLIGKYQFALKLRLRADGSLAERKEEEQFQLVIDAGISSATPPIASVVVEAPDFLVDGPLFDAFFSSLTPVGPVQAIADALRLNPGFVRPFLTAAKPGAAIFRSGRKGDRDRDIMVLSGDLAGSPSVVIINAEFTVDADRNPPRVELLESSVNAVRFIGPDPGSAVIGFEFIEYYLLLASSIRRWLGALREW